MTGLTFRPYAPGDRDACIEIFLSNTPQFFGLDELDDFRKFLDVLPCAYYVAAQSDQVLACGGYGLNDRKKTVVLAWGMARADLHRNGFGTFMLVERLKQIYCDFGETIVDIDTSQYSKGFFERFGFKAGNVTENFYARGLHRVDMALVLNQELYNALVNRKIG